MTNNRNDRARGLAEQRATFASTLLGIGLGLMLLGVVAALMRR
jgi:hypothetical protein